MKWLISIRGSIRIMIDNELRNAHTLLGEVSFEKFKANDHGATWTPGLLILADKVFFDGTEGVVSAEFYPPRRVVLETRHITALVEHLGHPSASVRPPE